ncbi:hypothetical protein RvY_10201 [Ramazzottius varieornatus]|uniref:Uncharacterized protein n=1 Tax=Ramazzottius varieornatus TaxID=947166 RepID=A0A1D1VJR9_RAMVA|nr:hypothetical protein RvY_10201 [Ramazzottius varieornatus]
MSIDRSLLTMSIPSSMMPSRLKNKVSSPAVGGKAKTGAKEKPPSNERRYDKWNNSPAESALVDWLEDPDNLDRWKFTSKDKGSGRKNTSGKTRIALEKEITAYLRARGFERSLAQVTSKLKSLETSYRKTHDELVSQTGTDIDDLDQRAKIDTVRKKLLTKCYLWDRLHPINCDRPSMVPPAVMDNTDPIDENEDENGLPMEEDVETVDEDIGLDEVADDVMHHKSTPEVE